MICKTKITKESEEFYEEWKKEEIEAQKNLAKKLKKAEKEARRKAIKNRKPFKGLQIRPTVSLFHLL